MTKNNHPIRSHLLLLLAMVVSLLPAQLHAQEEEESEDQIEPYELTWLREGAFFAGGIGVALLGDALHSNLDTMTVAEINALDMNDINAFDRGAACNYSEDISSASDVAVITSLAAPLGLMLADGRVRDDVGTVSTMYVETLLYATFVPSIGKGGFARVRPLIYNPEVDLQEKIDGGGEARSSFPSGHTTLAFASSVFFATVYADYHPDSEAKKWVLGGSLLLASSVGYFRYESGYHFPTDIIVGAGLGSAIGFLIPYFHRTGDEHQFSLLPTAGEDQFGAVMHYRF